MKTFIKYPLSIYIVWHPNFTKGKEIAETIYSIFCRNVDEPLSRGLGIPVYFRSVSSGIEPIPIPQGQSTRLAIVLLIDQEYFIDDNFRKYTESLVRMVDKNTRIYPVQLCDQAFDIGCGLNNYQFIRAYSEDLSQDDNFKNSVQKIKSELLNDCARLLMNFQPTWEDKRSDNVPSPIKLFLSHAKRDGLGITKRFKAYVDDQLKLDVFFDAVDIANGYEFDKQIEKNIENSALVVFLTDEYSSREWCRIEILIAKRRKSPIVVVHNIIYGEKRSFPYLGNTPTIALKEDEEDSFMEIVNLTLLQVINNLFQKELLKSIQQVYQKPEIEFITISSPPELFNYLDIFQKMQGNKKRIVVIYPEPPLGQEELQVLNDIDKNIQFFTPILLPTIM